MNITAAIEQADRQTHLVHITSSSSCASSFCGVFFSRSCLPSTTSPLESAILFAQPPFEFRKFLWPEKEQRRQPGSKVSLVNAYRVYQTFLRLRFVYSVPLAQSCFVFNLLERLLFLEISRQKNQYRFKPPLLSTHKLIP